MTTREAYVKPAFSVSRIRLHFELEFTTSPLSSQFLTNHPVYFVQIIVLFIFNEQLYSLNISQLLWNLNLSIILIQIILLTFVHFLIMFIKNEHSNLLNIKDL